MHTTVGILNVISVTEPGDIVIDETDEVIVMSLTTDDGDIILLSSLNDVTLTGLAGTAISAGEGGNILINAAGAACWRHVRGGLLAEEGVNISVWTLQICVLGDVVRLIFKLA